MADASVDCHGRIGATDNLVVHDVLQTRKEECRIGHICSF